MLFPSRAMADDVIGRGVGVEAQPASIAAANDAVIMKRMELPFKSQRWN
jgi:hypothetical protein